MDALAAWAALLQLCAPVFTRPGFGVFADLVRGWVLAPGRRTVTRMITAADPAGQRAHDAYHRFVRAGCWSMTSLWRTLATTAVAALCHDGPLTFDVDDTLFHHPGRHVNGAGWFRDAVRSSGPRTARAHGLNLVVVTLRVNAPWGGAALGLPVNVRLHRKDGDRSQPEHAAEMLTEIAGWFPQRTFTVCADGAYASLLGAGLPRTHIYTRMRRNAALFEPAPPRTGRRGRPRTRGDRLPTPAQLAADPTITWTAVDVHRHHRTRTAHTWSRPVLWHGVKPDGLVLLVIVRDPTGTEPDTYLVTDDLDTPPGTVIARYAGRWSIEITFRDTKQHLGGHHPQCWKGHGPERAAALSLWLHAAVWTWYIGAYGTDPTWTPRPWNPNKHTPSFHDALATLRRLTWTNQITPTSSDTSTNTEITHLIIDILANAA